MANTKRVYGKDGWTERRATGWGANYWHKSGWFNIQHYPKEGYYRLFMRGVKCGDHVKIDTLKTRVHNALVILGVAEGKS